MHEVSGQPRLDVIPQERDMRIVTAAMIEVLERHGVPDSVQREIADRRRRNLTMPAWANGAAIRAVYAEAKRLTRETGVVHQVDHIIPLQGDLVTGLHVESNLQILTLAENAKKRNKYEVE